ncbi:hypothetical protein M8818_006493 [Zalaria obscura]|uniref:Uncharacterized protein n=1 Tax=Zalaria obscura TaxID=2024903 RepID=A0ACC3S6Z1_9PEZI
MPIKPTPLTWTLRFKHHRTTVLLYVERTQTFTSIKTDLLHALKETNDDGLLNGMKIPDSPDNVLLAKPLDHNNLEAGWQSLDDDLEEDLFEEDAKSKGKAAKNAPKGKDGPKDCPAGAGLRDGGAVAFKFKGQAEEAQPADGQDEGLGLADEEQKEWDVVIPKYEDVYGMEDLEPDEVAEETPIAS